MCRFFRWSLGIAALLALEMTISTVTSIVSEPVSAQANPPTPVPASPMPTPSAAATFSDVGADYWALVFIQALAQRNAIAGFPDGTFRPNQPVERAEFAAMIQKAFNQNRIRQLNVGAFIDVPTDYWAASAIQEAYETGFMSGFPDKLFLPNQPILKMDAIISLARGLGLAPNGTSATISRTYYIDAGLLPKYAVNGVAAATQANIVVNYPNVRVLNPLMPMTRAEAAAHLYQTLVRLGQAEPLADSVEASKYIVRRATNGS